MAGSRPHRVTAIFFLVFGSGAIAPAAGQSTRPTPDSLRVAGSEPRAEAGPGTAEAAAPVVSAGEEGFALRSADGAFSLRFQGGAQYDARFFPGDRGDAVADAFDLRRVRADLRGTVYRDFDFRVNLDYAGNRVDVLDAYLDARFAPALQLRVGKFKEPVGLERLQSVFILTFAERGFPTALAPNRDVGAQLHGSVGGNLIAYAVGVFNGVPDGGSGDQDESDSKDLSGRVFVHPFARGGIEALKGLGVGVAGTLGKHRGSPAATGLPTLRTTLGRSTFLRYNADGTTGGTVVADGRRTRISPQGYWYWRNLGLLGEYIRTRTEVRRGDVATELTHTAWQIVGSWVVTGDPVSYRGVAPTRPFDPRRGTWGALELAFRIQRLEGDAVAFPLLADPAQSRPAADGFTIGLNWYLNRAVRFLLDYERTRFDGAPGGGTRSAENVLLSRFQVAF
jgi:phosphate-selective porin OprO/OprP